MLTHQRVCVLQVVVTVARGYGCLPGIPCYFQLFELCKTAADEGKAILHQSDEGTKWSAMVRCFPFLEETSERGEFWWTASSSADGANGLNRKSLAGQGVEKLRGELDQKCRNLFIWHFFMHKSLQRILRII